MLILSSKVLEHHTVHKRNLNMQNYYLSIRENRNVFLNITNKLFFYLFTVGGLIHHWCGGGLEGCAVTICF